MTTDLEKQFFECFNIPKIYRTAINIGDLDYNCVEITAPTLEQLYEDAQIDFDTPSEFEEFKNNTNLWAHEYPEITDHHYLELIILVNSPYYEIEYVYTDVQDLKVSILEQAIKCYKNDKLFTKHVQALFKEER
jgi:hypothetical protein